MACILCVKPSARSTAIYQLEEKAPKSHQQPFQSAWHRRISCEWKLPAECVCSTAPSVFQLEARLFTDVETGERQVGAEVTQQIGGRVRPTGPLCLCSLACRLLPRLMFPQTVLSLEMGAVQGGRCRGKLGLSPCSMRHSFRSVGESFPCKKKVADKVVVPASM